MKRITTIRNLFILLAALVFATGCTTAKTLGTPSSAVTATPAPSDDADTTDPSTDSGASDSSDSSASGSSDSSASGSSSETNVADTSTAIGGVEDGVSGGAMPLTLWMVSEGEHLWGISSEEDVYGDPFQWPLLFKRNRHQIEDADLIYPGQMLYIERDLSSAEIDRAIGHAKTRGAWILGITELSDLEYLSRERSYE